MPLYKGAGGAVFDITPPAPGTHRRENFDAQLKVGELVPVDPPGDPEQKPARPKPARTAKDVDAAEE